MFQTSQDILYITVAVAIAVFTGFLVWIMYYLAQITRQSNELITDFRKKMEELDATMQLMKDKLTTSVDTISSVSSQVANLIELIKRYTGKSTTNRRKV